MATHGPCSRNAEGHALRFRSTHARAAAGLAALALAATFAGCPRPAGLELRRLNHDGAQRSYYLYLPENRAPEAPAPLVLALHRFTETGARMARVTGFNALADSEHFLVAYPNGTLRRFNAEPDTQPNDAGFILAMIEDIAGMYNVDRSRIYLTGASNGGFLVYRLACEHPEVFAAAAPVMSAFFPNTAEHCASGPVMPMMIIHGDADPVIPYDTEEVSAGPGRVLDVLSTPDAVAFWVERNQLTSLPVTTSLPDNDPEDGTTALMEAYRDENGRPVVVHIRVRNGGHTWPGGREHVPAFIVGKQSQDFSASEKIWAFFRQHQRLGPPPIAGNL